MADQATANVWIVRWADFEADPLLRELDDDERARAARFAHEASRSRFIKARSLLRRLVGRELGVHPQDVTFDASATGKPRLADPLDAAGLQFSVSHADEWGLIGIARAAAIGVDVERLRTDLALDALVTRCLSRREAAQLDELADTDRTEAFLTLWTAKEALIKAQGETVPSALRRHELDLANDGSVALRSIDGDPCPTHRWHLDTIRPSNRHVATAAVNVAAAAIRWQTLIRAPHRAST